MKTQLNSFVRWLIAALYSLLSNPQRVRLVVTAIIVCVVVAAILVPSLAIVGAGTSTGGH